MLCTKLACRTQSFQRTPESIRDWPTWKSRRIRGIIGLRWLFQLTRLLSAGWLLVSTASS